MSKLRSEKIDFFKVAVGENHINEDELKENALLLSWCYLIFVKKMKGIPQINEVIDGDLSITDAYKKIAEALKNSESFTGLGRCFDESLLPGIESSSETILILESYKRLGSESREVYKTIFDRLIKQDLWLWSMPSAITELMWRLGDDKKGDVYTTNLSLWELAVMQVNRGAGITMETEEFAVYISVLALIYNIDYVANNAIESANVISKKGKLKQFPIVQIVQPNNARLKEAPVDEYNRYESKTTNCVVLEIENGLAHCSERLVALVPQGFLFNMANNFDLRVSLVDSGILDVVIQLPSNLKGGFGTSLVLIVIDKKREKNKPVLFYDAVCSVDDEENVMMSKERVMDVDRVANEVLNNINNDFSAYVSSNEIIENGYDLSVRKYSHNTATKKILSLRNTEKLSDIAHLIRAQQIKESEDKVGDIFYVVNNKDISESGIVNEPTKQLVISGGKRNRAKLQSLNENDIVLSIKGNVGTVGFIDERCEENWIANQIFMIVRLKDKASIKSSKYLFRYLKSPLVQAYLDGMAVGNAVRSLKSSDIKDLLVPVPSDEEEKMVLYTNRDILGGYEQIEEIREECEEQNSEYWPIV